MAKVIAELSARVHTFLCGLGGHEFLLNAEPGKMSLRCMSCPYETPGWAIKSTHSTAGRHTEQQAVASPQTRVRDSRHVLVH